MYQKLCESLPDGHNGKLPYLRILLLHYHISNADGHGVYENYYNTLKLAFKSTSTWLHNQNGRRIYTAKELIIINYCRLYLNITTVSELFDAEGTKMLPDLECQREPWFNPDTYVTLQNRTSGYQIRTKWQKLCRQWATADGQLAASIELGRWTVKGHQLRRRRQTYVDFNTPDKLYHWRQGQYWEYHRDPMMRDHYVPVASSFWIPNQACKPITVQEYPGGVIFSKAKHANLSLSCCGQPQSYPSTIMLIP